MESKQYSHPIAIVGASALYPGSVGGASFWNNILAGRDLMSEVPPSHWLLEDYHDPDPRAPGKIYARRGGFLPAVDFDPLAHGLPPKQLHTTDTAQLLGLIVAQKVLEDAASVQFGKVHKRNISVILGVASATELVGQMAARIQRPNWVKALRDAGLPESQVQDVCDRIEATYPEWDESTFPGLLGNVVAGRIANRLDLGGTNCVIDAACASSLGAVAMAVQELQLGHSDLVITGGADALNDIFMFMCFSKTPALSPSGDCRPFSDAADGTMLGEGIGMLALRRLADAERDGDKIYAVLRGVGSSSDGRAKSIYAPRAEGQEIAIRRAYERAGYGPEEVGLMEAHGTATRAGDVAEFEGLCRAFADAPRQDRQWCALGSLKSQIGHTKAAAGAASLFKVAMALHHKVLPPTIKVDRPNAALEIEQSPFYLNTEARPWIQAPGRTRKASVSSFGFGGSNFHVTLEEYAGERQAAPRHCTLPVHVLLLSADDADALLRAAEALQAQLATGSLPALARASQLGFDPAQARRLAILAADEEAAIATLASAIENIRQSPETAISAPGRLYYAWGAVPGKVAFLFPGQGSQYLNMGAALAMEFDAVRQVWDEAAAQNLDPEHGLHQVVFPIPVFSEETRARQAELLTRTDWAQPALGATSASMLALLERLGVRADMVAGHSYGELSALYAAGAIPTTAELLALSRRRGELMRAAAATPGAMLALRAPLADVQALLDEHDAGLAIANINSPRQVVVAGPTVAIDAFARLLSGAGISAVRLPVATAFHTTLVADGVEPFADFLRERPLAAPRLPVYGNTSAEPYPRDPAALRRTLAEQLARPVRFADSIARMHADGCRLFLEVGPGSVLTGMVGECLAEQPHVAIALDARRQDGREGLVNALAALSAHGIAVDYQTFWAEFAEPEAPVQPGALSAATVKIDGSNYGKLYPPREGAAGRPAPNPERPVESSAQTEIVERPVITPVQPEPAAVTAPSAAALPPPSPAASPVPVAPPASPTPAAVPMPAEAPTPAPPAALADPQWLASFQLMQQQALEAQKSFTEALSASHQAFLRSSEVAFMQLAQLGGVAAGTPQFTPEVMAAAPPPPSPVAPAPAPSSPAPSAPVTETVVSAAAVAPAPAMEAEPTPGSTQAPATATAPDHQAMLFDVVAEKTGYPVSMLSLDMELEAGLGIDSIKRVEILSVLQERIPELAQVDTSRLAALNTLGEIVAFAEEAAPVPQHAPVQPVSTPQGVSVQPVPQAASPHPLQATQTAPPPPVSEVQALDHQALLFDVVADKTGYPVSMLSLDMELEAGLGIDSIKRVEILSVLQERIPELAQVDTTRLAALNTLGEIVDFARQADGPASEVATTQSFLTPAPAPAPGTTPALGRLEVTLESVPAPGLVMPGLFEAEPLYLVGEEGELADLLATRLAAAGVAVEIVSTPPTEARALVILPVLAASPTDAQAQAALNERTFHHLRACADEMAAAGRMLVTVQATGGGFGLDGDAGETAWAAGIAAAAKTAALEWPNTSVKAIDVDIRGQSAEAIAMALYRELMTGGVEPEVGLKADGRRLRPAAREQRGEPVTALPEGVIVVSGGARGVTAACLLALLEHTPLPLAVLGRTALEDEPAELANIQGDAALKHALLQRSQQRGEQLSPQELGAQVRRLLARRELKANLARFEALGAKVHYQSVDITDGEAVLRALERVRAELGPIRGLIHAAGVLADKEIRAKTPEQFERVLNTKVEGLLNLLQATADDALTHIACFSSVAARRGNIGQVDYAMANEVLNRVCQQERARRGPGCLVKSIGWGPWAGGMVDAALEKYFRAQGVGLIPLADGARLFVEEFTGAHGGAVELVVGKGLEHFGAARISVREQPTFDLRFHRSTHPYLASHVTRDLPVVPMVTVNDLALQAARALLPDTRLMATANLEVIKGITLPRFEGEGDRFLLECRREAEAVKIRLVGLDGSLHYRLEVPLADEMPAAMPEVPEPPLQAWKPESGRIYDGRLFHGPALQVITALEGIGEQGCAGALQSTMADPSGSFLPLDLQDGGLQLVTLWNHEYAGCESLPTAIAEFCSYKPWSGGPVHCLAVLAAPGDLKQQWHLYFRDANGDLLAAMRGLCVHLLPHAKSRSTADPALLSDPV